MSGKIVVTTLFMIAAFYAPVASAATPDVYINEGKPYMFQGTLSGLRSAYQIFDEGINDPACPACSTDRELIFLHAVTKTAMLFIDNQNLVVQNSFLEVAEIFGLKVDQLGDLFDELDPNFVDENGCYKVPSGAPKLDDIPDALDSFLDDSIIPAVDDIIAELDSISDTPSDRFRIYFTPDETGLENNLEVDYGDLLVLKGILYVFKGLLQAQSPYDIFINPDWDLLEKLLYKDGICPDTEITDADLMNFLNISVTDPNKIKITTHILNKYPNLLKLLPTSGHSEDGAAILALARQDLIDGINYYFAALDYIRLEDDPPGADPQEDELLYLDPEAAFFVDNVDEKLIALRDSLLKGTIITCPIETLRAYSVSGADLSGALILEPDYGGLAPFYEGEEGSLTFLTGIPPSPWDVEWFEIGPEQIQVEVKRGEWPNRTWGYFEAVLSEDGESFSDGTFEWWGHEEGSVSGLLGELYSSEVMDVNVNLNPIFGSSKPVSPRDLLPQFDNDNDPIPGTFGHGLGDDATLGGILPDMTQNDWVTLLELSAADLVCEVGTTTLPNKVTIGDKGKVTVNVENQGQAAATGKIKIDVYASEDQTLDDDDTLLGSLSNQSIDLDPGKSKAFDVSVEIPNDLLPGMYYLVAYVDSANAIAETDEDNNVAASDGTVEVKWPDLVGTITHTFSDPAKAGDKAKVTVIVTNQSDVSAKGTINIPVYLSLDELLDGGDTLLTTVLNRSISLAPGKSVTIQVTVTLPTAGLAEGDYYFLANVDSTNAIPESDEDNNLAVTDDTLSVELPDLVGQGQLVTHTFADPAARGDKAKVKVVVKNQGNVLAKGKIKIDVYMSTDQTLDLLDGDALVGTATNQSINLKPGKSKTFNITVTIPADTEPDDYYFLANVDSTNAIAETDEDNNVGVSADTLAVELPDLVGQGQQVTHNFKAPAAVGAKGKVKIIVKNQGNVLAKGKINIDVYASLDQTLDLGGGDILVGSKINIPINLKKDKTKTVNINVTLTGLTPGDYYFLANVDSANAITESDEDNNVAATVTTLTVQ